MKSLNDDEWNAATPNMFWAEMAPTEHIVQIYDSDEAFLNLLESFVTDGFASGDCVVIIATGVHNDLLNQRLVMSGIDISALIADDRYIPLDADQTLAEFMVNGWPDATLFHQTIGRIIKRARAKNCRLRAFGEMVALLWSSGLTGATLHLENLWNRICETEAFCLLCAYPKSGFEQDMASSMHTICCTHSKMISGEYHTKKQILYKRILSAAR